MSQNSVSAIEADQVLEILKAEGVLSAALEAKLKDKTQRMRKGGVRLVVGIEGGMMTGVTAGATDAENDMSVVVADYDTDGQLDEDIHEFPERVGSKRMSNAILSDHFADASEEGGQWVDAVFEAYLEGHTLEAASAPA